ncbi:hypothetical protein NMY22_g13196 [Coprinellus aureogranulatus]|nr:hypothetical protein NMY22_g13196 [Coprinellus aureogranulatus]
MVGSDALGPTPTAVCLSSSLLHGAFRDVAAQGTPSLSLSTDNQERVMREVGQASDTTGALSLCRRTGRGRTRKDGSGCSSSPPTRPYHRHVALSLAEGASNVLRLARVQQLPLPTAGAQQPLTHKQAQSIGGVKKAREEKWEKKIAQERAHRVRDVPKFTRYPESKLQLPKTKDRPAVLPEPFQPGSGHALDLPLFGPSTLTPKHIGQATSFPTSPTNASKVFGLTNKMFLEYRILSTPTSIIRPITLTLTSTLSSAKGSSSSDSRIVLHGRAGSGKSYALHQAVQYAQSEGWVVVYVPRAVTLVNSTNSYIYDIPNASLLSKIPLKHSFVSEKLTVEAVEAKTLVDLAEAGIKDKSQQSAPLVLDALLTGLEEQKDMPVLVAVDDFQSLFHDSAYRDPFFQPIKPHHLSLPRTLLEYSSGSRVLFNGVFLGAVTESDTTYTVPVELEDAVGMTEGGKGRKIGSEYVKRDEVREGYVRGVKGVEVPERMTLGEMAGLFGVWKEDMALTTDKYDELFMSKYVESDGNPRDFVWKGLLATMAP